MATLLGTTDVQWFASWFDSPHYHRLYAYRDHAEAARFIDRLTDRLKPPAGAAVLDLGCGAGRHARHLADKQLCVTGFDLSSESLARAKEFEREGLRFARRDMRRPFGACGFDYVFNLFTSFGYFETAQEHLAVVRNIARSLKTDGRLVLDYLNVRYAERNLTREETVRRGDVRYRISRWIDSGHIFKRIVVEDPNTQDDLEYVERVARFGLQDFQRMFAMYGLAVEAIYGDYGLGAFDIETSPRLILVARRREGCTPMDYRRDKFLRMRETVSGVTPRYDASIHCGTRSAMEG